VFASRSPARALAARFPHIDHVWKTSKHLVPSHKNEFEKINQRDDALICWIQESSKVFGSGVFCVCLGLSLSWKWATLRSSNGKMYSIQFVTLSVQSPDGLYVEIPELGSPWGVLHQWQYLFSLIPVAGPFSAVKIETRICKLESVNSILRTVLGWTFFLTYLLELLWRV